MAKKKNKKTDKPKSMEEIALRAYQDRKKRIHREARIATELMEDKRFPILKKFIMRESQIAAAELSRILKHGTKQIRKGDEQIEVSLDTTQQLLEVKCLAYKCTFLQAFIRDPENAILEKEEFDEREDVAKEEQ